jgi:hypothetical protein
VLVLSLLVAVAAVTAAALAALVHLTVPPNYLQAAVLPAH